MKKPIMIFLSALAIFVISISTVIMVTSKQESRKYDSPDKLKNYCGKNYECYVNSLTDTLKSDGFRKTLELMNETAKITNGFNNTCHNLAHKIGETSFKLYGVASIATHDNSCDWGFGHGVMIVASEKMQPDEFNKYFSDFCSKDQQPIGCLHGLGHALGGRKITGGDASSICKAISSKYDATQVGIRKMINKSGFGVCIEGWLMQQLGDKYWSSKISIDGAKKFCEGVEKGEGMDVCISMALRNFLDYNRDQKLREESLKYFIDFCSNEGRNIYFECGRYLGESADEVYVNGFDFNKNRVAKGITETCKGTYLLSCVQSFVNFQLNRNNQDPTNIYSSCQILDSKRKKVCVDLLKDIGVVK